MAGGITVLGIGKAATARETAFPHRALDHADAGRYPIGRDGGIVFGEGAFAYSQPQKLRKF
jgi:hypothetical protein